jgi:hypothetical protein
MGVKPLPATPPMVPLIPEIDLISVNFQGFFVKSNEKLGRGVGMYNFSNRWLTKMLYLPFEK